MSVEYDTVILRGWELSEEDIGVLSEEGIDLFCDKGFLHWINTYSDEYPRVFGLSTGVSCSCGEIYSIDGIIDCGVDEEEEQVLCLLAENLFGITEPPSNILALRIH